MKRLPVLGPLAREGYHLAIRTLHQSSDREIVQRLADSGAPHAAAVAHAMRQLWRPLPPDEEGAIARIEAERRRLMRDRSPLIDGRFGEGGLFDRGMTVRRACQASKPPTPARLLYCLIRALDPDTVLELGTNLGISSAYQAMALRRNGPRGTLTTLEMSPYRLHIAEELHHRLGLANVTYLRGMFSETLSKSFWDLPTIDMAFIDGHHDYQPTLDYFHEIYAHASDGALLVFDDINWTHDMRRAWAEIQEDARVELAVDLSSVGLCIVRHRPAQTCYRVPQIRGLLA